MPIPLSSEIISYICGLGGTALGLGGFAIYKIRSRQIRRAFEIYEHNTVNDPLNPDHMEKAAKASSNFTRLTGQPIEEALKKSREKFHRENDKLKADRLKKMHRQ